MELYSSEVNLEIPFEYEEIEFLTIDRIVGRYTTLVRNSGIVPISTLFWIYPRPLLQEVNKEGDCAGSVDIEDISVDLPNFLPFPAVPTEGNLAFHVPDPNHPELMISGLNGRWSAVRPLQSLAAPVDSNGKSVFEERHIRILNGHGFTALVVNLTEPLQPNEAHWFSWRIVSDHPSDYVVPMSVIGPHSFHRFASPVLVHRMMKEIMLSGLDDFDLNNDDQVIHLPIYDKIVNAFELRKERKVDVQRHFLIVRPGDPTCRVLVDWHATGELQMTSGSPMVERSSGVEAPIFMWKSGSKVGPEDNPLEEGFMLRLLLAFNERTNGAK